MFTDAPPRQNLRCVSMIKKFQISAMVWKSLKFNGKPRKTKGKRGKVYEIDDLNFSLAIFYKFSQSTSAPPRQNRVDIAEKESWKLTILESGQIAHIGALAAADRRDAQTLTTKN